MRRLDRVLDSTAAVYGAALASVAIGVVFVFVRAPHPWGWEGMDHYHDLGLLLARGASFPTTDVPWGYAYFLAPFYWLFGDRPWIPLLAQVLLNGLVPILLYRLIALEFDRRVAVVAAVLTGVLSFNTVYASTQSSDAVCTVIFMAALVTFAEARARVSLARFAASGVLFGVAAQFRPNLVMLPLALAGLYIISRRWQRRSFIEMAVYIVAAALVLAPWTIRNYRLMQLVLPTSTHGGVQLWYGTLQTGPYLQSRVYNPRSAFEFSAFDYSSVGGRPLLISVEVSPCAEPPRAIQLVYWTDRRPEPTRVSPARSTARTFSWDVPGQPLPTVLYYFVEAMSPAADGIKTERFPALGAAGPAVHFINDAHLDDLDQHADLLDAFDVARMVDAVLWGAPLPHAETLDLDGDGHITEQDLRRASDVLIRARSGDIQPGDTLTSVRAEGTRAVLTFADGSTLTLPHPFSGRLSDMVPAGEYADRLTKAAVPFSVIAAGPPLRSANKHVCYPLQSLTVNRAFYLAEPDAMRRYTALAWDNIRHDPGAYLASCAYRAWRLFVVEGTDDRHTAYQFRDSGFVYMAATIFSLIYLGLFLLGVVLAIRQHRPLLIVGAPILYVPLTIAWVLTNMRYTVTVQPLVFAFIAVAVLAGLDRGETRTAARP